MIISVRGTNGSGKSTLVRGLIAASKSAPRKFYGVLGPRMTEALGLKVQGVKKPVYTLGSYHVESGGADQIQPYDLILELLEKYAALGHVVFEGVLVSSSYGRVGRLMEQWGQQAVMAFLATSLEDCLKNVQKRRDGRGDKRPFDPANATSKYHSIVKSRVKIIEEQKVRVVDLNPTTGLKQVVALLREAI